MADEHLKGDISTVKGTAKEVVGKVTGDKLLQAKGKAQQLQGKAQRGLGDVQHAVNKGRGPRD